MSSATTLQEHPSETLSRQVDPDELVMSEESATSTDTDWSSLEDMSDDSFADGDSDKDDGETNFSSKNTVR